MAYLFGKRFNDGVQEFFSSLLSAVDIDCNKYNLGKVLTKKVNGKKAAAVSLAALAGCTAVDPRRTSMQNACDAYGIPMFINDKLTPTASDNEVEALLNLDKVRSIEKAIEDYRDPQSTLTERQREILGEGASEIDIYLAAYNKLGNIDRKNKALKGISHDALRQKIGLERGIESATEQTRRKILNYAMSSACETIYGTLSSGKLFYETPLENLLANLHKDVIQKFRGRERIALANYAKSVYDKVNAGEINPTIVDRVLRELYLVGARPFQRPGVLIAPFCEDWGPIPTEKSMEYDGIFWGGAYKVAGLAGLIKGMQEEKAKHILGIGDRGERTGGGDAGRGR